MIQTAQRKFAGAVKLSAAALLLSVVWPFPSHADTAADVAEIVRDGKGSAPSVFCSENVYRRCFSGVSVQQCTADLVAVRPTCDQRVLTPIASLEQAFDAKNSQPFDQFGRNYGTCLVQEHAKRPQYDQAAVNACLVRPPFRPETLTPVLELILND